MTGYLASNSVFIISKNTDKSNIYLIDTKDGKLKWTYTSSNISADVMKVYNDNLYFVSKDKKALYMLDNSYSKPLITDGDIRNITDIDLNKNIISKFSIKLNALSKAFLSIIDTTFKPLVREPVNIVERNAFFELTIDLNESTLSNKYTDLSINSFFSNEQGETFHIKGFYFDKNVWKVRFVPTSTGVWKWEITIKNLLNTVTKSGSFDVKESTNIGFISISSKDPRSFVNDDGSRFEPIGFQDCTKDYNQDGDPLNQWFTGTENKPSVNQSADIATSMEEYMKTYEKSGFNLFRWGAENCSFPLWKVLSTTGNRYGVNEGMWTDTLFSSLRSHGFHVWMSLFSFSLPFEGNISEVETQTLLKQYMDYVVARYGGYVDVWELANEIKLDDELITFMSDYLKSIDPYHRPITTSWERPDHKNIEISSVHWYSQECITCHENDLRHQITQNRNLKKPVVFTEQGNWHTSWDEFSALRLRIRLWVGFFEKMSYIYWNSSRGLWFNVLDGVQQGPSNIYLGSVEQGYVSVFSKFINNLEDNLIEYPLVSEDTVYSYRSENLILGYIYRSELDIPQKFTTIFLSVPTTSTIQWISPSNGEILSEMLVQKGTQTLNSPDFLTDIAFKIVPNSQENSQANIFPENLNYISNAASVPLNNVYEHTIHTNFFGFPKQVDAADIIGVYIDDRQNRYQIKSFYFDKDIWKIRFVPTSVGTWSWELKNSKNSTIIKKGTFDVYESDTSGFISTSRNDPRLFTTQKGNIFMPIGIEDCTSDYNQDGDPLNQWFSGTDIKASLNTSSSVTTSLEDYLTTYQNSGFNMYRWGSENCSFPLWKTLSSENSKYGINEGMRVDTLFSSLKNHDFHIWMSLFGFALPFDGKISDTQTQNLLKEYLDYVVARFGGYVDVWELANEGKLDESLITFMSEYIKTIDPYNHPITKRNNPVVYNAQGNWHTNWDNLSAIGMRLRLWVGFFEKKSYVFWDTSKGMWVKLPWSTQGPFNEYLDSTTRQYVSVFSKFTGDLKDVQKEYPIVSEDNVHTLKSGDIILGYIYRSRIEGPFRTSKVYIFIPEESYIEWSSPVTGEILSKQLIQKGNQILSSPNYSTDVSFKITFLPKEQKK